MNIDLFLSIFIIVFPIIYGIMSTYSLVIALKGIITRRPFLVSNKLWLYLEFVPFIPIILLFLFLPGPYLFLLKLFASAFFTVVLVLMCFVLKGFTAYGISDITFREALITTLDKLQLSYEESFSSIRLTSVDADLQVSVHSLMGSGMIKIKQREHKTLLTQIVSEMNTYFRISSTPSNLTPYIIFLMMDILMIGCGVGLVFLMFNVTKVATL
ncbi:hypothetical protein C6497_11125 [Candidatus Poribacteria bacterium]|nr:MAG: hypothetical protein C6497_11125 [Candidatus Poribacteria bacterium]